MKLFMCFGGAAAAAVIDDDEVAEVVASRHRGQRRGRRSLSFRGKFLRPGNHNKAGGNEKKPSAADQPKAKRGMDADDDDDVYGVSRGSSSVASISALLSSASVASSLDSSDTSPSSSSRSSTASSSPSVSGRLYPPPVVKRQAGNKTPAASSSPAAGAAAVVLCLLMVVLCGRVGATLLTSMALYLFPRRWTVRTREEKTGAVDPLEYDAPSASDAEEEETAKRKVVMEGSLPTNRNK